MGVWFEDVPLGGKVTIGSYTFTEENIVAFAKKYDPQPFHIDKEAAERHRAEGFHPLGPAPRLHPVQRLPARQVCLPILRLIR